MQGPWTETMVGGSPEAERAEFDKLASEIMRVQLKNAKAASAHGVPHAVDRAFHAKPTLATNRAELTFGDLPEDLRAGFAQPGAAYPAVVRFSNAAGVGQPDGKQDLRGVAVRVQVSPEESHDLLATNFPVSHARNALQFVEFAKATAGSGLSRPLGILRLVWLFGLRETLRMFKNVLKARRQTVSSVATERYWSRGAYRWGPAWRCASCSGPHQARCGPQRRRRATRTTCLPRPLAGSRMVTSGSSCASSDTPTRSPPRSRTPPSSGRSRSRRRSRWRCSASPAGT